MARVLQDDIVGLVRSFRRQHREALDYALNLDYEKTTLFMALLLRDTDRDEALQEWLTAYLSACAKADGKPPPDLQSFMPWNMTIQERE